MITNEQVRQTVEDCKKAGHSIGMRDLSYVLLCKSYDDNSTAYRILFGLDADFNADYVDIYDQTSAMLYLKDYVDRNLIVETRKKKKLSSGEDISFEENKAAMLRLIKETEAARIAGEMDTKDALALEGRLRVELNQKFNVKEDMQDQVVYVFSKYDSICGKCGAEVSRRPISKDEAMAMYDLVEKE